MELTTVQEIFSCKTIFFKIDQLIADNPKSSKQTFHLSQITITSIATRWGGSQIKLWADFTCYQIKLIADQDCSAPYVGADFTEYQWRRCRTMIGEKPKHQIAFCACLRLTLPAKNISTSHH